MSANQLTLWYLLASVCFILALKGLSSPTTALVRALHHVSVRQDVTIRADDESRTERATFRARFRNLLSRHEAAEELLQLVIPDSGNLRQRPALHLLLGADIDDGGPLLLDQPGEVRQRLSLGKRLPAQSEQAHDHNPPQYSHLDPPVERYFGAWNCTASAILRTLLAGASPTTVTR